MYKVKVLYVCLQVSLGDVTGVILYENGMLLTSYYRYILKAICIVAQKRDIGRLSLTKRAWGR